MDGDIICESCTYYVFNEELEEYECLVNLDEDEYAAFLRSGSRKCPCYRKDDEYGVVKKQM